MFQEPGGHGVYGKSGNIISIILNIILTEGILHIDFKHENKTIYFGLLN